MNLMYLWSVSLQIFREVERISNTGSNLEMLLGENRMHYTFCYY